MILGCFLKMWPSFNLSGFAKEVPWLAQGETFFPVHVTRMELNPCHFPDDSFLTSTFHGQDTGVFKLDVMTQFILHLAMVYLSGWHSLMCWYCSLILILLECPVCPTYTLPVNAWCFQVEITLNGLKEIGNLPRWKTYSSDVMSHEHPANAVKIGPTNDEKAINIISSLDATSLQSGLRAWWTSLSL